MYAYDRTNRKWISLNTTKLSYDPASWGYNTAGTHDMGYTGSYFYGSSGLPVEDQKLYDSSNPSSVTGTIKQPDTPDFTKPKFKSATATLTSSKLSLTWSMDSKSCPCYEYEITIQSVTTSGNKTIHTYITSRPEVTNYSYSSTFKGQYLIIIKAKSISKADLSYNISKTI